MSSAFPVLFSAAAKAVETIQNDVNLDAAQNFMTLAGKYRGQA
jgi:hypothetical protein